MDIQTIQRFLDSSDPSAMNQYFEQLKESEDGWKLSINFLSNINNEQDQVKFFCFQVILHYVKTKYPYANSEHQRIIREFVKHWIQSQSRSSNPDNSMIQNKASQIICMVFLMDFPSRWSSFFDDLLETLNLGELETFTFIKDTMREMCITKTGGFMVSYTCYISEYQYRSCLSLP
ncbi:exportin-T [Caerostris extrusa]|uniref:Exportin-T n=1 Tax=Caerostris extrusa TaxID=172846 RepID=A0AAV4R875_CAEEX|nr:exportin-T [Caerostris extrusa]